MQERGRLSHSPVDGQLRALYSRPQYENRRPEAALMNGLHTLSAAAGYIIPLNVFPQVVETLRDRYEFQYGDNITSDESMQNLWTLIAQTHDARFARSLLPVSQVPEEVKLQGLASLVRESVAHSQLLHESVTIETQVKDDIRLFIGYDSANWEGIGAVYVYLQDSKVEEPVPAFIVRGNPGLTDSGKRIFDIRAVQPWISDESPSIPETKNGMEAMKANEAYRRMQYGIDDKKESSDADDVLNMLRERKRLVNRLTNALKLQTKDVIPTLSFITRLAMGYLRGEGITEFHGIAQNYHPEVVEYGNDMAGFNFDLFWSALAFVRYDALDTLHPWVYSEDIEKGIPPSQNEGQALQRQLIEAVQAA